MYNLEKLPKGIYYDTRSYSPYERQCSVTRPLSFLDIMYAVI